MRIILFLLLSLFTISSLHAQEDNSSLASLESTDIDSLTNFANKSIWESFEITAPGIEDFGYQIDKAILNQDYITLAMQAKQLHLFESLSNKTSSIVTAQFIAQRAMKYFLERKQPSILELRLFIQLDEQFRLGYKVLLKASLIKIEKGQINGFGEWDGNGTIVYKNDSKFPTSVFIDGVKSTFIVNPGKTQYIGVNAGCGIIKAKWADGSSQTYRACVEKNNTCNCNVK